MLIRVTQAGVLNYIVVDNYILFVPVEVNEINDSRSTFSKVCNTSPSM